MPPLRTHVNQARRNEAVYRYLSLWDSEESRQWQIVSLFYASLHWVEARFDILGMHNANHEERDTAMSRTGEFRPIVWNYRQLRTDSENIRYRADRARAAQLRQDRAYFELIANHIRALLPQ
jgi:hypothetical protein